MALVTINAVTIDPLLRTASADAANTNYVYVQSPQPLSAEQHDELRQRSIEIHEYVSPNTYLCKYEPDSLEPLRDLDFVHTANCFHNHFKIAGHLKHQLESGTAHDAHDVKLVFHQDQGASPDQVSAITGVPGVDLTSVEVCERIVRLRANAAALDAIKDMDGIRGIIAHEPVALLNNVAGMDMHAAVAMRSQEFKGAGQVISVNDSGLDTGDVDDMHPAFAGRVVALLGSSSTNDPLGHGTHVCGSALGSGEVSGVAPEASLVMLSMLDATGTTLDIPAQITSLFQLPYDHHARVSTNSWGQNWRASPGQKPYTTGDHASVLDDFVWRHRDMVVVVAAGNAGMEPDAGAAQVTGIAAAKNAITVGATYSSRPSTRAFAYDPAAHAPGDASAPAPFTSAGPTAEGRAKPDLAAPGVAILSAASRDPGLAPAARDQFGPCPDPAWRFSSGTSMAAPLVAGAAAVLRQVLAARAHPAPSAALVKALLVNGAVGLPASSKPTPSPRGGWGRVDLERAVAVPARTAPGGFVDDDAGLPLGATARFRVNVGARRAATPFAVKATLAWTDPPGPLLQNVLGLAVVGADGTAVGGDQTNNVQQVVWRRAPGGGEGGGDVEVRVEAVRYADARVRQPFAVVWAVLDA